MEEDDIDKAIQYMREVVDAIPEDRPGRNYLLHSLAIEVFQKYLRTREIDELDEAIQIAQEAVDATPKDDLFRPALLNNLGIYFNDRHERIGAMGDLEKATQLSREAVEATPKDHPDRALWSSNLGNTLINKYQRTDVISDLDEAINIMRESVNTIPKDHPERTRLLHTLGSGLSQKNFRTEEIGDLKEAIQLAREAITATPKDHPERAIHLTAFGYRLGRKFVKTKVIDHIKEAIQVAREAVEATPKDDSARAYRLNTLGHNLSMIGDLEEAVSCHQMALLQSSSHSLTRIEGGSKILHLAVKIQDWRQVYNDLSTTIHITSKLIARSLETSDKQYMLGEVAELASRAVAVAFNAAKGLLDALALLEAGRGILATSLQDIRIDVSDLRNKHPSLAEQFVCLRGKLSKPISRNTSSTYQPSRQGQVSQRHKIDRRLDALILKIREHSAFENFLSAPSEADMRASARLEPIIYINGSIYWCDAILIEENQIRLLPLPSLNITDIAQKANKGSLGHPRILEWLSDTLTRPVLDALGFVPVSGDDWPHVWWIPTGPLINFPLHAAGYHNRAGFETVLDRVMSSYSSSIKAIIYRRRGLNPDARPDLTGAVLVATQDTSLAFATSEDEVVSSICKSMKINTVELEQRKEEVIRHQPNCKLFHFAGHGHTNNADPSQSHLVLDEPLTVATLLDMSLHESLPFLAYLSACVTSQIRDGKFIDESIHLVNACQLAGFRHVIGTMWKVRDEICLDIARITYETMRDMGMTDKSVCLGLHFAVRRLRDSWVKNLREKNLENCLNEGGDQIAMEDDLRDCKLKRDAVLVEDDHNNLGLAHWIPYIHVGV
ncbi:hypothetical protein QQS21_008456 [Conoideocrella luteorostrata]|uniref:CHAT domain-containing protein n=1 Tax=Conoideocrella luteorostrata TaxID=1105319 RepID=A0AAJ0CN94_9HYPO|nr:hypothetical protein QQS21_008456 [Conoideocrella luteorostrata]